MRLVVINDFVGGGGGAAELAVSNAVWAKARGADVTFISGADGADERLDRAEIPLLSCGGKGLMASPLRSSVRGIFNRRSAHMLRELIAKADTPDTIYHLHNWSQILSPSVFATFGKAAHRLVLTAHDFFLVCPNGAFSDYPREQVCDLSAMSRACVFRNCDRRHYSHKLWRVMRQLAANRLRQRYCGSASITLLHEAMSPYFVRSGVDPLSLVVLRNPVRPFSNERVVAESNRFFMFIGRLHEGKGADLFLSAASTAGVQAIVIGDGPQREDLVRRFPDAEFLGWRTPGEIAFIVKRARAIAIPSRYPEPFGLIALEATYSGIPVIISNSAMLAPELVSAGAAISVEPKQTSSFAEVISRLNMDDATVRIMSESAYLNTRRLGSTPEEWMDGLERLYSCILDRARREKLN